MTDTNKASSDKDVAFWVERVKFLLNQIADFQSSKDALENIELAERLSRENDLITKAGFYRAKIYLHIAKMAMEEHSNHNDVSSLHNARYALGMAIGKTPEQLSNSFPSPELLKEKIDICAIGAIPTQNLGRIQKLFNSMPHGETRDIFEEIIYMNKTGVADTNPDTTLNKKEKKFGEKITEQSTNSTSKPEPIEKAKEDTAKPEKKSEKTAIANPSENKTANEEKKSTTVVKTAAEKRKQKTRDNFRSAMKNAGYKTLKALNDDLVLSASKGSQNTLGKLSRGDQLPFNPMTGIMSSIAEEAALLLGQTPQELFCLEHFSALPETPASEDPTYDHAVKEELRDLTEEVLHSITPRETRTLKLIFWHEQTLKNTGVTLDVTQERIRQIEAKALRKLRHPSRSDMLRPFIG